MAKLIIPNIKISYVGVNFDIHLNNSIVAIEGDSGTGKTLLGQALVATDSDTEPIYVYLDWKSKAYSEAVLTGCKNKILVIDNVDILLVPTTKYRQMFLNDRHNQYILMTRNGTSYGATRDSTGELYRAGKHTIKIDYPYERLKQHII